MTMSKHMYSTLYPQKMEWFCPVELISAKENYNIESIWATALKFRENLGQENLRILRQDQMRRGMWNFLGETMMRRLKSNYDNTYSKIVADAEADLLDFKIGGHEAASRILDEVFK